MHVRILLTRWTLLGLTYLVSADIYYQAQSLIQEITVTLFTIGVNFRRARGHVPPNNFIGVNAPPPIIG